MGAKTYGCQTFLLEFTTMVRYGTMFKHKFNPKIFSWFAGNFYLQVVFPRSKLFLPALPLIMPPLLI
jgi:hypothetical protein